MRATFHILRHNTGDVVHIHNGGNSLWAPILRLAGKRVYVAQDGLDWKRKKWSWYAKAYLWLSMYMTAYFPTITILDNIFAREVFEQKFRRKFLFIPYGSDFVDPTGPTRCENEVTQGELLPLCRPLHSREGDPLPHRGVRGPGDRQAAGHHRRQPESGLALREADPRHDRPADPLPRLRVRQRDARADEGLLLLRPALGHRGPLAGATHSHGPGDAGHLQRHPGERVRRRHTAVLFEAGNAESLRTQLAWALEHPDEMREFGRQERARARSLFSWDRIVEAYEKVFTMKRADEDAPEPRGQSPGGRRARRSGRGGEHLAAQSRLEL